MYHKALSIYYGLAIFVIGAGFFVIQPTTSPEMAVWQNDIKQQISVAWKQTMGDQPWFEEVALVYNGVNEFYDSASAETVAVLDQPELNEDIVLVFGKVYSAFAAAFGAESNSNDTIAYNDLPLPQVTENFMTEEPIYNIVPYRTVVTTVDEAPIGKVAAAMIDSSLPVNSLNPWVTIQDNFTGQLYCLAIYNATINKYLGPCKNEYQ